jgi:hypothetical protein
MKENGVVSLGKDLEDNNGLMDRDMRVTGLTIRLTVLASFTMQMEMFTKESGQTIKQMEKEHTHMLMVLNIKEIGRMISSMAMELRLGLMVLFMRVNILKEKRMAKVN